MASVQTSGLFYVFQLVSFVISMHFTVGQICENLNLDVSNVTERSVTLNWSSGDPPYTIEIIPHPCDTSQPEMYYGCSCNEDDDLELIQTTVTSEHTLDKLFPGRLYEFHITVDGNVISSGCSYTVPRQPTTFRFDALLTPNPTVDAIGVEVNVSIDEGTCSPALHSEFSNIFMWYAGNGEEWSKYGNITKNVDQDGHFRFKIEAFSPGREYMLSIRTSSGNMLSEGLLYQENDGKFRTAIPSVTNVRLGMLDGKPSVVWDHVADDAPHDNYLIIANTTVPSDIIYERYSSRYNYHALSDLIPGYAYEVQVENVLSGYKQQDPPEKAADRAIMKPQAPANLAIVNRTTDSVIISWDSPLYANDFTNLLSYNVSVRGTPCDSSKQCFCTTCIQHGDANYTTSSTQLEIISLFSGREHAIEVRTVTTGPIASDPADSEIKTLPRPPVEVKVIKDDTTNTSKTINIVRSEQCDNATEAERYAWFAIGRDGRIFINGSLPCDETRSNIRFYVDNLEPGEEYDTCVRTLSGNSTSAEKCCGYTKTKINAPIILSTKVEDGNKTISVTWDTVHGEIDGFELLCKTTQGDNRTSDTLDQAATSGKCEDITPGALYNVTVNTIKEGYEQYTLDLHNDASIRPYPTKPNFNLLVLDTSTIKITWVITGHLDFIKYQIDGGPEQEVLASLGHIEISKHLQPNGMYNISIWGVAGVKGENDFETATQKDLVNFQMYSSIVGDLTVDNINASTIEIIWNNPPGNAVDTGLNHYIVQLWNSGECFRTIIMNNTELPHIDKIEGLCGILGYESFTGSLVKLTLSDVGPCSNHTVTVIPVNTVGNGIGFSEMTETDNAGPSEPVEISVDSLTATEINIMWNKPEPLNCPMSSRITFTYIVCENGGIVTVNATLKDTYEYPFPGLQPFTDHNVIVEVFNDGGSTDNFKVVKTLSSEPGPPQGLRYTDVTHDSANIIWDPVNKCDENGMLVGYLLQFCSRDKLDINQGSCNEVVISDSNSYQLTGLAPYYEHTCTVKARNDKYDGSPMHTTFDTEMYYPDNPTIKADANCDGFQITIDIHRLNGPLQACELEIWKPGSQDRSTWSCNMDECNKYGNPSEQLEITQEHFDETIDMYQGDTYIIEGILKNTQFDSEKAVISMTVDNCSGSSDVGLAVGLSIGFCLIGAAIVGVVICKRKGLGPFGIRADSGKNGEENDNTTGYEDFSMGDYEQVNRGGPHDGSFDETPYLNSWENGNADDLPHYQEIQYNVPGIDNNGDHETTAATITYEKLGGFTERHVYN